MKHFIGRFLAGLIMPSIVIWALYSANASVIYGADSRTADHSYVVLVIDAWGKQTNEFKGTSKELDPFQVATEFGAAPFAEDKITVTPDLSDGLASRITINRAPDYTILDGKKKIEMRSWQETVGGLIVESQIPELGLDDRVNFALDEKLEPSMKIVIIRVAKTTVIEKEAIDFKTITKSNPNVEKGNKKVLQAGEKGSKNKYYLVTREDGIQISKVFTRSEVAKEPVDEIIEVGTKVIMLGTGKATWYTRTTNMIAAHNSIKSGTKVRVVNLANGKSVVVTIVGGGIYHGDNVVIDLSTGAFEALGASLSVGKLNSVRIEKYYPEG